MTNEEWAKSPQATSIYLQAIRGQSILQGIPAEDFDEMFGDVASIRTPEDVQAWKEHMTTKINEWLWSSGKP